MSRLIGYARVSTNEQDLSLQIDALKKAGCEEDNIFIDKVSGAKAERPGLRNCLERLQAGDTLLVWRLDRLGRSTSHLIGLIENLRIQKINFKSICDGVFDTTTASGELVFNFLSCLAHFERRLNQERTKAGLDAARARGRVGGRKPIGSDNPRIITAKKMHQDKTMGISAICEILKISRPTFYRYLKI